MNDLIQDIRFAWRNALKQPATALLIVATLALGIGANSAMFSMAWHVLFAPLPYDDGNRLVRLEQNEQTESLRNTAWSIPTLRDFREQGDSFSDLVRYDQVSYTLLGQGDPYLAKAGIVNWKYFDVLGIRPLLGRGFVDADDDAGAAPVMLLSQDLWRGRFAANPDIVGTTLEMNNAVHTIIGVLPDIPPYPDGNDVWVTTASDPSSSSELALNGRNVTFISHVFGKLREDVSLQEASLEADTIARRLATQYPDMYTEDYSVVLEPIKDEMIGESGTTFLLLPALAFLVVLIASANVANLNLARLVVRTQELAIREALGADPGRIRRQLFSESLLFALAGGVSGVVIAYPILGLLAGFAANLTPLASEIRMDGSVLLFSLVFALLAGLISGSVAAFNSRDINKALKEGGDKVTASTGGMRRKQALLIIQYALSFVILAASALITLSLYRLNGEDAGYDTHQVQVMSTEMVGGGNLGPEGARAFIDELLEETRKIPGVESAAVAVSPFLQDSFFSAPRPFQLDGQAYSANFNLVSEDYFEVMNIPLLRGRLFTEADDENATNVAIVNESFARRFFPGGDAIGQEIQYLFRRSSTIVGVVPDLRSADLDEVEGNVFYANFRQAPSGVVNLYVKTAMDSTRLENALTTAIHGLNPRQAVGSVNPLNEIKAEWLAPRRLAAMLIGVFGVLALVVTLSGVVGVVSNNISQRIREISVHMAVGANPANITRLFFFQGLKIYLGGLLAGLLLMMCIAPMLEPMLYQVAAVDLRVYLAAFGVLTLTVFAAIYWPASKASAMSPAEALKEQ